MVRLALDFKEMNHFSSKCVRIGKPKLLRCATSELVLIELLIFFYDCEWVSHDYRDFSLKNNVIHFGSRRY